MVEPTLNELLAWLKRGEPRSRWTCESLATLTSFSLERERHRGEGLALVGALRRLKQLEVSGDYRTKELAPLSDLAGVEHLRIQGPKLTSFAPFSNWAQLEVLEVRGMKLDRGAVESLEACTSLRTLRLWNCTLDAEAFLALSALRSLEELDLSTSTMRKKKIVAPVGALGALPRLRRVSLGVDVRVTDASLAGLCAAPELRSLSFWGAQLSGASAAEFAGMALTDLNLGHAPGIDDKMLEPLVRRRSLRSLVVSGSRRVTGRFLARLPKRPALAHIELDGCALEDASLGPLARCEKLEWLSLSGTPIGDAAMHALLELPRVERIDLTNTAVTAEGLSKLPPHLLERVEVRDDEARVRRARQIAAEATPKGDYLALRIVGTVGHAHVDATLVHSDPSQFWAELGESLARPVEVLDLEPGLDWRVLEYRDGALRREIDLLPALRIHPVKLDGTLGRGLRLEAIQAVPARREKMQALLDAGREHRLSVRHENLSLPDTFAQPLPDDAMAVVPAWFDAEGDLDESPPQRIVPMGWS